MGVNYDDLRHDSEEVDIDKILEFPLTGSLILFDKVEDRVVRNFKCFDLWDEHTLLLGVTRFSLAFGKTFIISTQCARYRDYLFYMVDSGVWYHIHNTYLYILLLRYRELLLLYPHRHLVTQAWIPLGFRQLSETLRYRLNSFNCQDLTHSEIYKVHDVMDTLLTNPLFPY